MGPTREHQKQPQHTVYFDLVSLADCGFLLFREIERKHRGGWRGVLADIVTDPFCIKPN